jgi:HlyD family type I secretion membrane fusion protein
VGQLEQQVAQVRRQRSAEATRELEEVLAKLADARDRQIATRDVLNRTVIRAPVAGHVLGLNVNTIGAVVERGETLFEVVPTGSAPMIEVRLAPDDGQLAEDGMKAQVRFLSNKSRRLKPVWGKVTNRSVDLLADERTGEQFYTLQVTIDPLEAAKLPAGTLSPGAPVEVVVPTGSRTALQYLLDPIRQTFSHGMREH